MKTLTIILCLLCAGCIKSFEGAADPETGQQRKMFGKFRAVVGERRVVGVELPPLVLPVGFGAGFWIVRQRPPAVITPQK